jgi:hypothetical protein
MPADPIRPVHIHNITRYWSLRFETYLPRTYLPCLGQTWV